MFLKLIIFLLISPSSLLADTPPAAAGGGLMGILPLFAIIFLIFYLLVIRPQEKERRVHQAMIDGIKPGVSVLTTGGIIGKVFSVNEDEMVLEVAANVRVRFKKSAILSVADEGKAATVKKNDKKGKS
jgi:preprotein translocase subunit YajC